jgi:DNA-binding IclR family transcriptional regulator
MGPFMPLDPAHHQVLTTLLRASASGRRLTVTRLAQTLGRTVTETRSLLLALDHADWVDAGRVRLTLQGFALAVASAAAQRRAELAA